MTSPKPPDRSWHIQREIPIALIATFGAAVVAQTLAASWWASATTAHLNAAVARLEVLERGAAPHSDRLTRVEEQIKAVHQGIERVERIVLLLQQPRSAPP